MEAYCFSAWTVCGGGGGGPLCAGAVDEDAVAAAILDDHGSERGLMRDGYSKRLSEHASMDLYLWSCGAPSEATQTFDIQEKTGGKVTQTTASANLSGIQRSLHVDESLH
jgi:hypothetical protein